MRYYPNTLKSKVLKPPSRLLNLSVYSKIIKSIFEEIPAKANSSRIDNLFSKSFIYYALGSKFLLRDFEIEMILKDLEEKKLLKVHGNKIELVGCKK